MARYDHHLIAKRLRSSLWLLDAYQTCAKFPDLFSYSHQDTDTEDSCTKLPFSLDCQDTMSILVLGRRRSDDLELFPASCCILSPYLKD